MKFAAYDDVSIYGVGDTPNEAIANARLKTRQPGAHFETALISNMLARQIEKHGWGEMSQAYGIDSNGRLVPAADAVTPRRPSIGTGESPANIPRNAHETLTTNPETGDGILPGAPATP